MIRFRRRQDSPPPSCTRKTCCTDNPGAETTAACFNPGACGCQAVDHPAHPTPDFRAGHSPADGSTQLAQEKV